MVKASLYSHGVHGFLGHHGILPVDLLARGRQEVKQHGGVIIEAFVTNAEKIAEEYFRVTAGKGKGEAQTFYTRRLLLATGLKDLTPDCPGFSDFYGVSVFHCRTATGLR